MHFQKLNIRRSLFDISLKVATLLGMVVILVVGWLCIHYLPLFLTIGVIIYLGLGLPRWIGRKERLVRAVKAKESEFQKWGFHSRDREGPWLNYIDKPLVKRAAIAEGKYFYSEWLIIHNGLIVVNPGATRTEPDKELRTVEYDFTKTRTYAWDGCTPKRWFFWFALFGTPDWDEKLEVITTIDAEQNCLVTKNRFWQRAHHASLVHDALYQYLDSIPLSKNDVDELFYQMLIDSGFYPVCARVYRLFTMCGGGDVKSTPDRQPKPNFSLVNVPAFLL